MKNMKSCDDINQSKCFEASAVGQAILKRDWVSSLFKQLTGGTELKW